MDDIYVVAAILTLALHTAERERPPKSATERWRRVWTDFERFLKELGSSDRSIDKRGINPD
jgi:hypothetical protein